jgi:squalene-associated FAD-dependent desaturase
VAHEENSALRTQNSELHARVVVVGAGFAGLSAAVRLADAGLQVAVVEAAPRLGGRASTFRDPATGERVDNGQHVLFGCYRETYAFLRRLGTDKDAPLDRALTLKMIGPDGRASTLSCPRLPSPWHLLAGVLRWDAVPLRDRATALRLWPALRRLRRTQAPLPESLTVQDWLAAHGQSPELCRWLWHPLAIAALNQAPAEAAAAPFVRVLADLFGPRADDSAIGVPIAPLEELYARPAARLVEQRGGLVLTGAIGRVLLDEQGRIAGVRAGGSTIAAPCVISAVPWHAVAALWEGGCPAPLADLTARASRMRSSPIVSANLWFDRPVMSARFVGLIGGPMHWVFDKSAIFGGDAGHIAVVSSGADELVGRENDQIVNLALADLERALPEAQRSRLRRAVVVRERRATFSLAPGEPRRPETRTPLPGFFLAGDWLDTGLPATIESAVLSGRAAADAVLTSFQQQGWWGNLGRGAQFLERIGEGDGRDFV